MLTSIRNVVVICAILFASCQFNTASATNAEYRKLCVAQAETAQVVMQARQLGIAITKLQALPDASSNPIFAMLIDLAYMKPRYNTEDYKQKAIADFGAEIYTACMQYYRNK